jgi:hypothetical protein
MAGKTDGKSGLWMADNLVDELVGKKAEKLAAKKVARMAEMWAETLVVSMVGVTAEKKVGETAAWMAEWRVADLGLQKAELLVGRMAE